MSAAIITAGWQAYRRAAGIAWPDAGRRAIGRASVDLWTALEMHGRLGEDECASEDLLAACAEKAEAARERLIAAIRQHCGQSGADFVSDREAAQRSAA